MKLFKWIKKTASVLVAIVGKFIGGAYAKLNDVGKLVVPIAVNVVQTLKTFVASETCDIITEIVSKAIPGVKDDVIITAVKEWLRKELPKIAVQLEIVESINNLQGGPESKVQAILEKLKTSDIDGAKYLEFATQLSLYLSDGILTAEELRAAADDYYNKFVKN